MNTFVKCHGMLSKIDVTNLIKSFAGKFFSGLIHQLVYGMQQANKEKLINLITRPYKALPLCADLPRLGPFMKIFDQHGKIIVDEAAGGANPALGVLNLLTTLAKDIEGEESAKKISDSFLPFFAGSDLGTIAITLQRFIDEVMGGDESRVITVLKCVNQTAISPAIIELKFALGNQCMTKDVKLGWKIEFYLKPEKILIKSRRKEMCIKNTFQYEWTLTFELTRDTWHCTDLYIDIISIIFHEDCPEDRRGLVKRLLEKYCAKSPAVLLMADKVEYTADSEGTIKMKPRRTPPPSSSTDEISATAKRPVLDSIDKLTGSSGNSPASSPRPQPKAIHVKPNPLKLEPTAENGNGGDAKNSNQTAPGEINAKINEKNSQSSSTNQEINQNNDSKNTPNDSSDSNDAKNSAPSTPVRPQLTLKESLASLHKEHVNTLPVPTTPTSPNTPREEISHQKPVSLEPINSNEAANENSQNSNNNNSVDRTKVQNNTAESSTENTSKNGNGTVVPVKEKDPEISSGKNSSVSSTNEKSSKDSEEVLIKRVKMYPNGDRYEGEFNSKGVRHGRGVYTTTDGNVYVGEYKDGTRHGRGTYTMHNGSRYEGTFERGVPNGKGVYVFQNGDLYTGDFKDDEFHGQGSWSSMTGATFVGEFKQGRRCGKGMFWDNSGNRYEGDWNNDLMDGHGKYKTSNGDIYEGNFKEGKFEGQGVYYFAQHGFKVSGDFKAGKIVKMT